MQDKKTIIIATNAYPPHFYGGAELIAESHAKALLRKGHRVIVFTPENYSTRKKYDSYEENYNGVPVCRIRIMDDHFDVTSVSYFERNVDEAFRRLVEKYRPQVLHCQNIIGSSLGIIEIAKEYDMKVFITLHDYWGICYKNTLLRPDGSQCTDCEACAGCMPFVTRRGVDYPMRLRRDYFSYIFSMVDCFVSPSQYLADRYVLAGFAQARMRTIWNGIDFDRFKNIEHIPAESVRFTFAGYLGSHKGIHQILYAMGYLKDKNIRLNLAGDGEMQDEYKEFVQLHGMADRVKFWGKLQNEEMNAVYANTDVYILASVWPENQPVSITEALACGIPVITADLGGSLELVKNGLNGCVYHAQNSLELARCMEKLADDPALRRSLGKNGQLAMSRNTFDNQIEKILALYDEDIPKAEAGKAVCNIVVEGDNLPQLLVDADKKYSFLMRDWLENLAVRKADAFLVPPGTEVDSQMKAEMLQASAPLILPETLRGEFSALPTERRALFYNGETELPNLLKILFSLENSNK